MAPGLTDLVKISGDVGKIGRRELCSSGNLVIIGDDIGENPAAYVAALFPFIDATSGVVCCEPVLTVDMSVSVSWVVITRWRFTVGSSS